MIPRIQGRVEEISEGEHKGKFVFDIYLTTLGGGDDSQAHIGQYGPWETRAIAMRELKTACKIACESIEIKMLGYASGKYIDMKTNATRSWEEH